MSSPAYTKSLSDLSRHLQRWQLIRALVVSILAFVCLIITMQLLTYFLPLGETWSINIFMVMFFIYLIGTSFYIGTIFRQRPQLSAIANRLERYRPELYDHLNCAVELQKKSESQLTSIEKLVIDRASQSIAEIDTIGIAGYDKEKKYNLLAVAFIGLLLIAFSSQMPVSYNLIHAIKDRLTGMNSGMEVIPGSAEFPIHSDINVMAAIKRTWHRQQKNTRIEFSSGDAISSSVMYSSDQDNQLADFTFYDTAEPVRYRIVSADHQSDWYLLSIFEPPILQTITWHIEPPEYTGLPEESYTNVNHLVVPEGSRLLAAIEASSQLHINMISRNLSIPLEYRDQAYRLSWTPESSAMTTTSSRDNEVYFHATNLEGRTTKTGSINLSILVDDPPVVEIVHPGVDIGLTTDKTTWLELYIADDYGVYSTSLHLDINGLKRTIPLSIQSGANELRLREPLNMLDFDVNPGDLLYYYLEASDNRQPSAQTVRSEIFFIEVGNHPDDLISDISDNQASEGDADTRELPIRDFIAKTKKIIRDSFYIADNLKTRDGNSKIFDITQETLLLKQDMNRAYVSNKKSFRNVDGIDTGKLLLEAIEELEKSIALLDRKALEESLRHSSAALHRLVKLDTLLRKLASSGRNDKGSLGSNGSSEDPLNKIKSQSDHEKRSKRISVVTETLKQTKKLIDQQQKLNVRLGHADRLPKKDQSELARVQIETANETKALERRFYDSTGKQDVTRLLKQAHQHMKNSGKHLENQVPVLASPQGIRALDALQMAAVTLKREIYKLAMENLDHTRERGEQLVDRQKQTMKETQEGANPLTLEKEQQNLNRDIDQYANEIQQASRLLKNVNNSVSQSIAALTSKDQRNQLRKHQHQAVNAIVYELFENAGNEQEKIIRSLAQTTEAIDKARQNLASDRGNVLAGTVQQMSRVLEEINQRSGDQLQSFSRNVSRQLREDELINNDFRLREAVQLFDDLGNREEDTYLREDLTWALERTLPVLQEQLWQKALRQTIEQSQKNAPLPEQYRHAVEDYFRRLAEEEK